MSYIKNASTGTYQGGVAAVDHVLSSQINGLNEIDDGIFLNISIDGVKTIDEIDGVAYATAIGTTWNEIRNISVNGIRHYILWRRATAVNETMPTLTISANDELNAGYYVVYGMPTGSNPIGNTATNSGTSNSPSWNSINYSADSTILYMIGMDGSRELISMDTGLIISASSSNGASTGAAKQFENATGLTGTVNGIISVSDGWDAVTIEVLDNGNGETPIELTTPPVEQFPVTTAAGDNVWRDWLVDSGVHPDTGVALPADVTFDASAVDIINNYLYIPAHGLTTGYVYRLDAGSGTLPTGLADGQYHFIHVVDVDNLQLMAQEEITTKTVNALGGYYDDTFEPGPVIVPLTAVGSGTCSLEWCGFMNCAGPSFNRSSAACKAHGNAYSSAIRFATARDMTGERFNTYFDFPGDIRDNEGFVIAFDGSGNYKTWKVQTSSYILTISDAVQIELDSTSEYEHGTFDITDVLYLATFVRGDSNDGRLTDGVDWNLSDSYLITTAIFKGGQGTLTGTWDEIYYELQLHTIETSTKVMGVESQLVFNQVLQFSDGVSDILMDDGTKAIEFIQGGNIPRLNYTRLGIRWNLTASSTLKLDSELISSADLFEFKGNPASNAAATLELSSLSLSSPDITMKGGSLLASTISNASEASIDGAEVTNSTFKESVSTAAIASFLSNDEIDGASFDASDSSVNYHIELDAGVTAVTLKNVTFIGTPSVNKVHVLATVGTVFITLDDTSLSAGEITSEGALIDLIAPTADLTVNSDQAASLIQIFSAGTQTILDSTTGTQLVYTHSSETVDIVVQKAGFIPQRRSGIALSGNVTQGFEMVTDLNYDSGHGLVYVTDASWSRTNNELTVPAFGVTGLGVYSLMIDSFIAESALRNTDFNMQMNGPQSLIFINDAEGVNDATITNMTQCGVEYRSSAGVETAEWVGIDSSGVIAGSQPVFQQSNGGTWTNARSTGDLDEVVKTFGDISHGNFDKRDHLDVKANRNGYRPIEVDVLTAFGIAQLSPILYVIALPQIEITGLPLGDPAPTGLTLTDDSAAPISWDAGDGAKDYSITVTDTGANTGETILRWLNYNTAVAGTFEGKSNYDWGEIALDNGSAYESIRGTLHLATGDVLAGVRVINGSGDPQPSFTRFQSDDGTYGTPPVTATASITNLTANSRIQIYNITTDTEVVNAIEPTTAYSLNYTDGVEYTSGDVIRVRITYVSGVTAKLEFSLTVVATTQGWSVIADQVDHDVYNDLAVDGSTITDFTADYINNEVDVVVGSLFLAAEWHAWWVYNGYTEEGIRNFFGGVTALDVANFRINNDDVNIFFDNTGLAEAFQQDNRRIYRADGARPVKNPTTSGFGVDVEWREPVLVVEVATGAGADWTEAEKQQIRDGIGVNGSKTAAAGGQLQDVNNFRAKATIAL